MALSIFSTRQPFVNHGSFFLFCFVSFLFLENLFLPLACLPSWLISYLNDKVREIDFPFSCIYSKAMATEYELEQKSKTV